MRDQAEILRMKMLESQGALGKSLAIVSGKGGVGKSNFTTNFAALLAKEGKNVVILDMDIGMGNIHILFGKTTEYSLKDYLQGNVTLKQAMFEGPNGVRYISGGSGMSALVEWSDSMFEALIEAFRQLQQSFDYILFDMGAGATNWSLDLLTSIDEIIVISTAEPTAIMDAYSMMKFIHLKDSEKTFYLLCNRVMSKEEGQETLSRLNGAMQKFMSKEVIPLGSLPEDPVVRKAVREQVPFTILYPNAPISKTMQQIVQRFLQETTEEIHAPKHSNNFLTKLKSIFSKGRD
ncbi:MinD/ParA family protein [Metasolibacillus sp.]|uniref:MinD/ParA family protein n=1 Tax=Metasolibacillus sp. TaxID=2703680 RepID=UPI0025D5BB01|nr:MinD/ParA family protein [Metasolibacillus sp.]MCT6923565.1 MinD/ParA family protein [Metasolibacillus sp.]MCT6939712.1 MinD/ParA family protein [Metasolibacillus sp.]